MLWGEAARHVVWLMNCTSTKAVAGKTPYEAAFGKKPDLSQVHEWGEKVWVRIEGGESLVDVSEKVDGLASMKGAMVVKCTGRISKP